MKTTEYVAEILNELHRSAAYISNEEADQLADHILSSHQIFTAGAGRSGTNGKILRDETDAHGLQRPYSR